MLRLTFVPGRYWLCTDSSPRVFFYSLKSVNLDFCSLMLTTIYESKTMMPSFGKKQFACNLKTVIIKVIHTHSL